MFDKVLRPSLITKLKIAFNFSEVEALLTRSCTSFRLAAGIRLLSAQGGPTVGLGILALLTGGCQDPVRQEQIAALGPEAANVPPGPLHRPGQPCLLCHESMGPANRFTVAGTVFQAPSDRQPVGGVQVQLIDAARRSFVAYTNCVGSFSVTPAEYEPVLPLWVSLSGLGLHIDMESPMHKDGDCGFCHRSEKSSSSAGHVFLSEDPLPVDALPAGSCQGGRP